LKSQGATPLHRRRQQSLDAREHHFDRDTVVSAAWNDDVRPALRWLHKLDVHRAHGPLILFEDGVDKSPSLFEIALDTAQKTNVVGRIDEYSDVHPLDESRLCQHQDPLDDDHRSRIDPQRLLFTDVRLEVVDRLLDRLP
jgi:hypothetical protein